MMSRINFKSANFVIGLRALFVRVPYCTVEISGAARSMCADTWRIFEWSEGVARPLYQYVFVRLFFLPFLRTVPYVARRLVYLYTTYQQPVRQRTKVPAEEIDELSTDEIIMKYLDFTAFTTHHHSPLTCLPPWRRPTGTGTYTR